MDLGNNRKAKSLKQKGKLCMWCTNNLTASTRAHFPSGRNSLLYSGIQEKQRISPMDLGHTSFMQLFITSIIILSYLGDASNEIWPDCGKHCAHTSLQAPPARRGRQAKDREHTVREEKEISSLFSQYARMMQRQRSREFVCFGPEVSWDRMAVPFLQNHHYSWRC